MSFSIQCVKVLLVITSIIVGATAIAGSEGDVALSETEHREFLGYLLKNARNKLSEDGKNFDLTKSEEIEFKKKFLEEKNNDQLAQYKQAKAIFAKYCHRGRPIKRVQANIVAVIKNPSVRGLALDEFQKEKNKYRDNAKSLVKNIFYDEIDGETDAFKENSIRPYRSLDQIEFLYNGQTIDLSLDAIPSFKDINILRKVFTINLPVELQRKYYKFKIDDPSLVAHEFNDNSDAHSGFAGFLNQLPDEEDDNKGHFSPKKAIDDLRRSWLAYSYIFTKFSEAPDSTNPSRIKMSVELPLDFFCEYSVSLQELTSR